MKPIIIVGAGWAGLSAALSLSEAGLPVTLIESAEQPGGRARSLPHAPQQDNGQHLLIGAYRETLRLLNRLNVDTRTAFHESPFDLVLRSLPQNPPLRIRGGFLPGQLHLLQGLMGAQGLDWKTRINLLRTRRLLSRGILIDTNARDWLSSSGQTTQAIDSVWAPLCLAALNLPLDQASSRVLQRTLREAFGSPASSRLLIPRLPLGQLLPNPAVQQLQLLGADIKLGNRVTALSVEKGHICGVSLRHGVHLRGTQVVLAVAPTAAVNLLRNLPETHKLADDLHRLGRSPIVTAYLQFGPHMYLDPPMQALTDGTKAWLFDRRIAHEPGRLAAVVSGPGITTSLERDELVASIVKDVRRHFPQWGEPSDIRIIREKTATFLATPDNERLRPSNETALEGLWLAGDYCATGLPATLEGAVRSGLECATQIIRRLH